LTGPIRAIEASRKPQAVAFFMEIPLARCIAAFTPSRTELGRPQIGEPHIGDIKYCGSAGDIIAQ